MCLDHFFHVETLEEWTERHKREGHDPDAMVLLWKTAILWPCAAGEKLCMYGYFCPLCLHAQNAADVGVSLWTSAPGGPCVGHAVVVCCACPVFCCLTTSTRRRVREKKGIKEDACQGCDYMPVNDYCLHLCCCPCATVQEAAAIRMQKDVITSDHDNPWASPGDKYRTPKQQTEQSAPTWPSSGSKKSRRGSKAGSRAGSRRPSCSMEIGGLGLDDGLQLPGSPDMQKSGKKKAHSDEQKDVAFAGTFNNGD